MFKRYILTDEWRVIESNGWFYPQNKCIVKCLFRSNYKEWRSDHDIDGIPQYYSSRRYALKRIKECKKQIA